MGSNSSVAILDGGAVSRPIDAFVLTGGDFQQTVREVRADTAAAINNWTIATSASLSQIAADINRVAMTMAVTATATGRVYLRFDGTAPTSTVYHWYLDPGERFEVGDKLCQLAVSMLGTTAVGSVLSLLATAG